jgi:diadenosine tetraphosphate (Ap4A) HIT family hydrolase
MFALDPQLQNDCWKVGDLQLCRILLAKNAAWPWLILVPMRENVVEVIDLSPVDQAELWREVDKVARVMREIMTPDKLNIAAIGNVVRQLHVHIIGRYQGDPGWPAPVWASGFAAAYTPGQKEEILVRLNEHLHH